MIAVDSHVPIPATPEDRRKGLPYRYPFARLQVGDSFHATGTNRNALRCTATYHEKRRGHRYRIEPEGAGFRVWRIA